MSITYLDDISKFNCTEICKQLVDSNSATNSRINVFIPERIT